MRLMKRLLAWLGFNQPKMYIWPNESDLPQPFVRDVPKTFLPIDDLDK